MVHIMESENVIDGISYNSEKDVRVVLLHLFFGGDWSDYDNDIMSLMRRLNEYIWFCRSGQLRSLLHYDGQQPVVVVSCEKNPPEQGMKTLRNFRSAMNGVGIDLRLTVGFDLNNSVDIPNTSVSSEGEG